jgi:hypothetical protein
MNVYFCPTKRLLSDDAVFPIKLSLHPRISYGSEIEPEIFMGHTLSFAEVWQIP